MARNEGGVLSGGIVWRVLYCSARGREGIRLYGMGMRVCSSSVTIEGIRFGRSAVPVVRVPSALIMGMVGFPKAIVISTAWTNACLHLVGG